MIGRSTGSDQAPSDREPATRQGHILLTATAVDTFGTGLNYAVLGLFLVRVIGLTGGATGLVLGIAAGIGLPGGYLAGRVVDTHGPRRPLIGAYLLQGVFATMLPFASSAVEVAGVLSALLFCTEASRATRYAAIARIGPEGGVTLRARSTVVSNIAAAAGIGVAGLLIAVGHDQVLRWGLWANAATFFVAAAIQVRLHHIPPTHGHRAVLHRREGADGGPRSPWTDRPYLAVVLVNAVLTFQAPVFALGYPLWVTVRGRVPIWMISVILVLNTILIVCFQMRVVRRVATYADAARGWRRAGVLFFVACLLMAGVSLDHVPAELLAVVIVLVAAAVHTCGELWYGSGQFSLALGLAKPAQMGRYQGVFNLGEGVANALAPAFVGFLCTAAGAWGWILLGSVLVAGAAAAAPVVKHADRTRLTTTRTA